MENKINKINKANDNAPKRMKLLPKEKAINAKTSNDKNDITATYLDNPDNLSLKVMRLLYAYVIKKITPFKK